MNIVRDSQQPIGNRAEDALRHLEADQQIARLYNGRAAWQKRDHAKEQKLSACFATLEHDSVAQFAFCRLIYGSTTARLATIEPISPLLGASIGNTGLDFLLQLARFSTEWLREPEAANLSGTLAERCHHLTRHLFALYAVPAFLDAAWLSGLGDDAESYRNWFVHLAQGEKLEALRFPMPMTHRAAHHFLQAPSHFSIPAALHWGQIRAANGSAILAEAVAESFLHDLQEDESFWFSAVIFFVNHSDFPNWQIAPALDYLRFRKAQEPNFTMKGRTATALLSLMQEWHETLARMKAKTAAVWNPSGIRPMKMSLPDTLSPALCDWFMIEITDALSLVEEGREMRHCVRSYQEGCVLGKTSIWSLRLRLSDSPVLRRMLTVEVNNQRRSIVQVRGKCNQVPSQMQGNRRLVQAKLILKQWASSERLGIACRL